MSGARFIEVPSAVSISRSGSFPIILNIDGEIYTADTPLPPEY